MSEEKRMIADRYEVGALIGRGGMADVYEGIDTRLGRKIAIKILKADLVADPSFEAKFRQEAQNSARMTHPTIVRVYDSGEEQSVDSNGNTRRTPYIVMEFVSGTVLRDLMHARKLTSAESIGFAEGILTALEFSHRAGIIHRDIKSANIMITDGGVVKVMDFGIARAMSDSSATQSHTQGIVGTAQYFSPEQARGESVDARTDLYSTGVLLYEMLAGRPPFVGESAVSVAYQHVSESVTPPSAHNSEISAAIDEVVMHSLAKDRNDRYQSAEQFREHLLSAALAPAAGQPAAPVAFTEPLEGVETTKIDAFDELLGGLSAESAVTAEVEPVTTANTNPFETLGVEFEPEIVDTRVKVEQTEKSMKLAGLAWGVGSGLVVFVIGMVIFVLAFGTLNVNLPTNKNIEVVDVVGQTFEDGAAKLTELGLSVVEKGVPSDTVPADEIISTDPPAGASVPKETEITVTYSTGAAEVAVPSLLGKSEQEAKDALTSVGLILGTITQGTSPSAALGKVIQSSPETGTYTTSGSAVDLIISNGKVEVPNVTSMSVSDATNQLQGASVGLTVKLGTQEVGCANPVPQGQLVLGQSIAPGSANQHSTITLYVACNG
ncbi:MAG: Stk1 family PASTA domain-containing Ser/Thr kinase [Rhodoluna sp.]|nr:Stk1 family PASTA domain-containing Ser/Thr kinase [Rhodoluna sp.]